MTKADALAVPSRLRDKVLPPLIILACALIGW
jgi:hypothetical protein